MNNIVKKYPIFSYYTIAFGWTWTIVFFLIFSGNANNLDSPSLFFIIGGIISGIAPSMAAIIVTRISEGKEGVEKLISRIKKSSSFKFYWLSFAIVPIVTILTTIISNFTIRSYSLNIVVPMIIMGLVWPLFSSFGEELGWRGYILPKMLTKYSALKAGIILGTIWEIWHLPMHYIAYKDYGIYMIPAFLVIGFINIILQSVIMTNIFVRSNGNLKLMIIYHYTITSSSIIVGALFKTVSTPRLVVYEAIVSVSLFFIMALILYINKKSITDKAIEG